MLDNEQSLTFGESLNQFSYKRKRAEEESKAVVTCVSPRKKVPEPVLDSTPAVVHEENGDKINQEKRTKQVSNGKDCKTMSRRQVHSTKNGKSAGNKHKKQAKIVVFPESFEWKSLLRPNLKCVFIGFNPGTVSAITGHHYAHHSNLFWKLIYESGCVDRKVTYEDDVKLPDEYNYGFTDLIQRPTVGISDLSGSELLAGVPLLESRIRQCAPKSICFIGKGIWESVYRVKKGKPLSKQFNWGLQPHGEFGVDYVFVFPSTSGLVGGIPRAKKLQLWIELAEFLNTDKPLR